MGYIKFWLPPILCSKYDKVVNFKGLKKCILIIELIIYLHIWKAHGIKKYKKVF